jgi:hypothetical protein
MKRGGGSIYGQIVSADPKKGSREGRRGVHPGTRVPLVRIVQYVTEFHVQRADAAVHAQDVTLFQWRKPMLHFFNGGSPLHVLEHAIAVAVADKPREKFAIAQLMLHQPVGQGYRLGLG